MNYYETLYIIHPALESGRLKDIIMDVEGSLKKLGGGPLAIELWGKRKLAYFIDKQKYGTYVLVQYNGEGKCTRDFAVELEHNPNILAYLTTNINQDDVIEQEEDLETQIAGKTREAERKNVHSAKDVNKNLDDNSAEVKNDEKTSGDKDGQTNSQTEDIKDSVSESVLDGDDKNVDVVAGAGSETRNESDLVEENPTKETELESNQEKENESNTISEKE